VTLPDPSGAALFTDRRIGPTASGRAILGCASFGGIGSTLSTIGTGLEEREAFAVMDTAVALGITIFDTADGYAGGRSEEIIGAWLVRGGAATVSTKVGVAGGTRHGRNLAPERILEHAETSRRRLGLPTLPMYMVHAPDPERPVADSLRAFDQLHRDGVIQSLGICNVDVTILEEWLDTADRLGAIPVSWVQNEYSLIVRRDETAVLGFCQDHGPPTRPIVRCVAAFLPGATGVGNRRR